MSLLASKSIVKSYTQEYVLKEFFATNFERENAGKTFIFEIEGYTPSQSKSSASELPQKLFWGTVPNPTPANPNGLKGDPSLLLTQAERDTLKSGDVVYGARGGISVVGTAYPAKDAFRTEYVDQPNGTKSGEILWRVPNKDTVSMEELKNGHYATTKEAAKAIAEKGAYSALDNTNMNVQIGVESDILQNGPFAGKRARLTRSIPVGCVVKAYEVV